MSGKGDDPSLGELQSLSDIIGNSVQRIGRDNRVMRLFLQDIVDGKYHRATDIRRRAADLIEQLEQIPMPKASDLIDGIE